MNNQITGIILLAVGGTDLFFAIRRINSAAGKLLNMFNKIEEIALVLLISGIIVGILGILKLLDK